jgi:3-hydroxy-9,10-secoandrosta-1,3,5(10)-triene-9,17-dione monooxygenase reductase component
MNTEPAYAPEAERLRHALGHFATGVTVITSVGPDGEPVGTTATAVASLSLEPGLLLVCLDWRSATLRAILGHRAFAVNVLAHGQEAVSRNFARRGEAATWAGVAYDRWPSGNPRLNGTLAGLDCALEDVLTGGDHEIVTGRVLDAGTDPQAPRPLVHWRGQYANLERR